MKLGHNIKQALAALVGKDTKTTALGYDAVDDKKRRTAPRNNVRSEDRELQTSDRQTLIATTRDNRRNFAITSWMVNKHLDFVSTFEFQSRTGNAEFDQRLEDLVRWWSRPKNCDVTGRHSLQRMTRLLEAHAVVDGDCFLVKLSNGKVQAVEGDRVRKPKNGVLPKSVNASNTVHGVVLNNVGRAVRYVVHRRVPNKDGMEFDRLVPARNVEHHGYFTRFDQVRGISPLATSLNTQRDVYENIEYDMVKSKMASLFGISIERTSTGDNDGFIYTDAETGEEVTETTTRSDFDGIPGIKLELDTGEVAKVIESKHPSKETQSFYDMLIRITILALDLPYTFYNTGGSSFSASRQEMILYIESAKRKRTSLQEVLSNVIAWKISQWTQPRVVGGETVPALLELPTVDGKRLTLPELSWEWIPAATPWIDPLKEVQAALLAINAGLKSRQQVSKEMGVDWKTTTAPQLAEEEALAVDLGFTMQLAQPGASTTRDEEQNNPANMTEVDISDDEDDEEEDDA